jgi:hypothetical protein
MRCGKYVKKNKKSLTDSFGCVKNRNQLLRRIYMGRFNSTFWCWWWNNKKGGGVCP